MPKKKRRRKKKVIHEKIVKIIGFSICAIYGSPAYILTGRLNFIQNFMIDERGKLGTRAAAEKEMKKVEKQIREEFYKPPRNMPKDAKLVTGLYVKDIIKSTSKMHKVQ